MNESLNSFGYFQDSRLVPQLQQLLNPQVETISMALIQTKLHGLFALLQYVFRKKTYQI